MSAKLLYSLSDDKPSLRKQIGCMNGFLQLFDRHHVINGRVGCNANNPNRNLPPGDNRHQEKVENGSSKKSKEKNVKVIETQGNPTESSRMSISSSVSTIISSFECDSSIQTEQSAFGEDICTDRRSWNSKVNQDYSSPHQSDSQRSMSPQFQRNRVVGNLTPYASPIRTAPSKQVMRQEVKHVDSPRLLQLSQLDSPRLVACSDSFRSISSNQNAPALPLRKKATDYLHKDGPRFSYDGRETRETYISSLKLRDLPRLSLDSRQRTRKEANYESKEDLLHRDSQVDMQTTNLPEEPGSYRPPSNIIAKLMGLEALPDCSPSIKSQIQQHDPSIQRSSDLCSRSSRTINESKVNRGLHSPRNNSREAKTPRSNNAEYAANPKPSAKGSTKTAPLKQLEGHPPLEKVVSMHQELKPESKKHTLTVYGEMEKRLNDLDFKRSGKDLRALKQILESMQKEKTKLLNRKENCSSECTSETGHNSPNYISQKQVLKVADCFHQYVEAPTPTSRGYRFPRNIKSTGEIKPTELVKSSRDVQKKTTKHLTPEAYHFKYASNQTHFTIYNSTQARIPRPKATSRAPQHITKVPVIVRTQTYSNTPATTSGSRKPRHKKEPICLRSHDGKLQQKSITLRDSGGQSSDISTNSASMGQGNTNWLLSESISSLVSKMYTTVKSIDQADMIYDALKLVNNNINAGVSGDTSPKDLTISVREQPSPVSVLDANFYEEESLSPVKKKSTTFREDENDATYTEREWKGIDVTTPEVLRPNLSCGTESQKLENFKRSPQALWQLYTSPDRNENSAKPDHKEENQDKAYVFEVLTSSGFLDDLYCNAVIHRVHQSQDAIDPRLFYVLEQTKVSEFLLDNRCRANGRHRRLLFDTVNEILSQKLASTCHGTKPELFWTRLSGPRTDGYHILEEIFKEIDQLQANSLQQSLNDEEAFLTNIIGKDLSHVSGNWILSDVSCATPGLVLDIERLIFKDLIIELVQEEATKVHAPEHGHK